MWKYWPRHFQGSHSEQVPWTAFSWRWGSMRNRSDRRWISLTIWVRESAASASSFMWTTLDALPLSQILQVHVMQCEQWAPTGRNINLHERMKQNLVRATMQHRSVQRVCACHASTFYITNLSAKKMRCEQLLFHVGLRFYDERSRNVEKALKVMIKMYQVYIYLSIYLSIYLVFVFCFISS